MADFLGIGPGLVIGEGWTFVPPYPGAILPMDIRERLNFIVTLEIGSR